MEVLIVTVTSSIRIAKRGYKKEIVKRTLLFVGIFMYKTGSNEQMSIEISIRCNL